MITKNHPSAYAELFKRAEEALSSYGSESFKSANIKNIDDYFACLAELARIEEMHPESIDPIFTILPATEQTFNIDADKRTIAIPDNFAKYGVGVQGDEIAEILYFSIDRYFDAMDLADMDIIVQWRHEKDDPTLDGLLSATYKKSLTLQPGKIVFGWPITSEITERSGNIKFSIRFYRRENNELIYSFSTLTATIKIQTGLDFALNENATNLQINKNSQIYRNLRNSKKANIDYVIAAPSFTDYYVQTERSENLVPAVESLSYDLPISFVVKAAIAESEEGQPGGAGLSYSWYDKNNSAVELESAYLYQPVEKATDGFKEVYYHINAAGEYETYYIVGDDDPFDDQVELYVRCSKFVPQHAGTYYAIANNIFAPGAYKAVESKEWIVPGPSETIFEYPDDKKVLLTDDTVDISLKASVNGKMTAAEWYYNNTAANIDGASKLADVELDEDVNEKEFIYTAENEGYYFLKITNTKNNSSLDSISEECIWVSRKAGTPVISSDVGSVELGEALSINVTITDGASGVISYQWYDSKDEPILNATQSTYTPTELDSYKCVVTNTYNGESSSATSGWLAVTPANN